MSGFFTETHNDYPAPEPETIQSNIPVYSGEVKSVSFSTLTKFEQCKYSVFLSKVVKIPGVSGPAADRGSEIHEKLEDYVMGKREKFPWTTIKAGQHYAPIIDEFRKLYKENRVVPEFQLTFTKDMQPSEWDAPNCWLRGAIDVLVWENDKRTKASLYDYKTGQDTMSAKHRSQLMLYALLLMILYPELEEVRCAAIYLDIKKDLFYTSFTRQDIDMLWPRYLDRLQQITNCENYDPNPNGFTCRWCQHAKPIEELEQTEPACEYAHVRG